VRSCNHCCRGKTVSITGVCVGSLRYPACNALGPYCYLWPVRPYNIFSHYPMNGTIVGKIRYWTWNVCCDFIYKFYSNHFSFQEELNDIWSKIYIGLYVKYPLLLSKQTWIFWTDFRRTLTYQISCKSVQWDQAVPCGRTYGRTDGYTHDEANSHFLRTRLKCNKRTFPRSSQQSL